MHPAYDFDIPPRYPVFILLSSSYLRRLGLVFIKSLGLRRQTTYLVMRSFLLSKAIHLFQKRLVYKLNRNFERNLTARLAVRQPNIHHASNDDNPQLPCRRQKHCKGRFNGYVYRRRLYRPCVQWRKNNHGKRQFHLLCPYVLALPRKKPNAACDYRVRLSLR